MKIKTRLYTRSTAGTQGRHIGSFSVQVNAAPTVSLFGHARRQSVGLFVIAMLIDATYIHTYISLTISTVVGSERSVTIFVARHHFVFDPYWRIVLPTCDNYLCRSLADLTILCQVFGARRVDLVAAASSSDAASNPALTNSPNNYGINFMLNPNS